MRAEREMSTPVGVITLCQKGGALCAIRFGGTGRRDETPLLLQAQRELEEYFAGRRTSFSVPLSIQGTEFQQRVWRALQEIPYGQTLTYGEIARRIGRPKAGRAVGMANHCNPIPIIVPCHRVVGANGRLTGYAGGLAMKKMLLEIEGIHVEI